MVTEGPLSHHTTQMCNVCTAQGPVDRSERRENINQCCMHSFPGWCFIASPPFFVHPRDGCKDSLNIRMVLNPAGEAIAAALTKHSNSFTREMTHAIHQNCSNPQVSSSPGSYLTIFFKLYKVSSEVVFLLSEGPRQNSIRVRIFLIPFWF